MYTPPDGAARTLEIAGGAANSGLRTRGLRTRTLNFPVQPIKGDL
jgi:hypothetical protein